MLWNINTNDLQSAQTGNFHVANFDTSSGAITFLMYRTIHQLPLENLKTILKMGRNSWHLPIRIVFLTKIGFLN